MDVIGELERIFAGSIYPNRVAIAIAGVTLLAVLAFLARRRHWDQVVRRHPRASIASVAVAAVALGPIAWYLGSPLILSTTVDEPAPAVAASPLPTPIGVSPTPSRPDPSAAAPSASPNPSPVPSLIELTGKFAGADDFHFGRGTARLIETAPGRFTVRLEQFAVRNGPDLYVYLSPSPDGYDRDAIELGRLKADRGNQNYPVPVGTDVRRAASIVIWCRQFSVLFATAPLG